MAETSELIGNVSVSVFLLFLFTIIFTFILGSIVNLIIMHYLKDKYTPTVYKPISKAVMYAIYATRLYLAFVRIIALNVSASLAALGILGIGMLLPAVPILQNIAAGIVFSFERPFKEDDIVQVDGKICKVKDIMLRKTVFRSLTGEIITIPNVAFMTGMPIINYSRGEFLRIDLQIDISIDSGIDQAVGIINSICHESPNILPNIPQKKMNRIIQLLKVPQNFFVIPRNISALDPRVEISSITKDKVSLKVWFWYWDVLMREKIVSSFYRRLAEEFKKSGIKFG